MAETPLYESGQKIQFLLLDKKGKQNWFDGVIHGVRQYEDPATNAIIKMTYLIDTGRHERIDEYPFNHRDREVNSRVEKLEQSGMDRNKAFEAVVKHTDLPPSKMGVERVRQPEQIELGPEFIRPAK